MNDTNNSNGPIIAVIVVVIILLVGWFAYSQGFFTGAQQEADDSSLQIDLNNDVMEEAVQ